MSRPTDILWMTRPSFRPLGEARVDGQTFPMPSVHLLDVEKPLSYPFVYEFDSGELHDFGPESFRVDYQLHSPLPVLLNVQVHSNGSEVKLSWNPDDAHSFSHSVDFESLQRAAGNPDIWAPEYTLAIPHLGLEWWNPPFYRVVTGMYPPPGPFLELCFSILRAAGFHFETQLISAQDGMQYYSRRELLSG